MPQGTVLGPKSTLGPSLERGEGRHIPRDSLPYLSYTGIVGEHKHLREKFKIPVLLIYLNLYLRTFFIAFRERGRGNLNVREKH